MFTCLKYAPTNKIKRLSSKILLMRFSSFLVAITWLYIQIASRGYATFIFSWTFSRTCFITTRMDTAENLDCFQQCSIVSSCGVAQWTSNLLHCLRLIGKHIRPFHPSVLQFLMR